MTIDGKMVGPLVLSIVLAVFIGFMILAKKTCDDENAEAERKHKRLLVYTAKAEYPNCKKVSIASYSQRSAAVKVCGVTRYYRWEGDYQGKWVRIKPAKEEKPK